MQMSLMQVTLTDMQGQMNQAVSVALEVLEKEGLLTKPNNEIVSKYAIVLQEKTVLGKIFQHLFKTEKDEIRIHYMKKIV